MERKRTIIAACLGIVILLTIGAMLFAKDTMFRNKVVVSYPDGCVETYINTRLTTPMCIAGRIIAEQQATIGASANQETAWIEEENWHPNITNVPNK